MAVMLRLPAMVVMSFMVAIFTGCRPKQPLVLHVYRDRTSPIGRELDRRFYELSSKRISLPSGRQIVIASIEPRDYKQMLRDRIGNELMPELIVLNSSADVAISPTIGREATHAANICSAVRACPIVVPAFVPSWVSNRDELQAAQQVLQALRDQR